MLVLQTKTFIMFQILIRGIFGEQFCARFSKVNKTNDETVLNASLTKQSRTLFPIYRESFPIFREEYYNIFVLKSLWDKHYIYL